MQKQQLLESNLIGIVNEELKVKVEQKNSSKA